MTEFAESPDFQSLFESLPGLYLVLTPDLTIVAVSDAYLKATMTERKAILGRKLFDVFPDNPGDPQATGVRNLRASLDRVLRDKTPDTMAVQKYDIRRPESEGGGFEERYWSPVNSPVFRRNSKEIAYINHRVEDVTEFIRLQRQGAERDKITDDLRARAGKMESEIYLRGQELQEANRKLRAAEQVLQHANEGLEAKVAERSSELLKTNRALQESLEELRHAQGLVVQQERLTALGEMASGIAHDFNNALSPILGYTELIIDDPVLLDDKTALLEYLRSMNVAAKDAASVVRRLREFSRPREKEEAFARVDLNALIGQTVALTQFKWKTQALARGATIQIATHLEEIPPIEGNEAEIREALTNLIFNAVDAIPAGNGSIALSTSAREGWTTIEIADTGSGMSEETRLRCLEPFFTTKGEKGTGLGLSMVYGIIQRHKGRLDIRSRQEEGTAFSISFPAPGKEGAPAARPAVAAPFRRLRILYVEDEEAVRNVIQLYLKRDGHAVETAGDGKEGLKKFSSGRFDLVITDHVMPEMHGEHLAQEIKKKSPEQIVVLLSGSSYLEPRVERRVGGLDAVLRKPVTIEELRGVIRALFPA